MATFNYCISSLTLDLAILCEGRGVTPYCSDYSAVVCAMFGCFMNVGENLYCRTQGLKVLCVGLRILFYIYGRFLELMLTAVMLTHFQSKESWMEELWRENIGDDRGHFQTILKIIFQERIWLGRKCKLSTLLSYENSEDSLLRMKYSAFLEAVAWTFCRISNS